ncbi:methyltransferase [Lentzea sp. HUAS TT2]|uniref:methyltransferase n=1 Tax=Lentzea sp. HUAS TT2 TaxID=3447454 RepID=UPI003F7103ED
MGDRVPQVPGDFTESVPATGDVYLLSRVLHDWDDEQCRTTLTTCSGERRHRLAGGSLGHATCSATSAATNAPSPHYRALLADAGFEITATVPLPLDAHALRARTMLASGRR